jgi:hypothetical protein
MAGWAGTESIRKWFAQHLPRGAVVPFEAPALRMARVCDDERDGLIAILRDFANNGAAYIVPWASLPRVASMTDHDVAMHKAIGENKASTPAQVRAVISALALSGALGSEAKARASGANQTMLANVELALLLHLLDSCGAELATLTVNRARWRDTDAKAAVAAAAAAVGVRRKDIYQRIGEFTRLLAPIGLVATDGMLQPGWLRVLHGEIEGFGQSVAATVESSAPDARPHLTAIAQAASGTARLAGMVLSMIDYAVLDIGGTVRRWEAELPVLRQAIERLSLMLDEWPSLMKLVRDALRGPPGELINQLRVLCAMLPRLPEAGSSTGSGPSEPASISRVLADRLSAIRSMLRASRAVAS